MTSMEAAGESARHAVNAILDHYVWVESGGLDRREKTILNWQFPFGFIDQGFSSPLRMPTPAGDYCYVFDIENREPADTRALRALDSQYSQASLPHPLDTPVPPSIGGGPMTGGIPMTSSPTDPNQQLLAYLAVWQQLLEQTMTMLSGLSGMAAPGVMPGMAIPTPPMPQGAQTPTTPNTAGVPPSPTDYAQQLFGYLQAWRQYLEHATGAMPGPWQPPAVYPTTPPPSTALFGDPRGYGVPDGGRGGPDPARRQGEDVAPDRGEVLARTAQSSGSQSATRFPPDAQVVAPVSEGVSQVPGSLYRLASKAMSAPDLRGPGYERSAQILASRRAPDQTPEGRTEGQSLRASSLARTENVRPERGEGINAEVRPRDLPGIQGLRG
jgi:hypothetical protein